MDGTAAARLNDPIAHTNAHARFWAKFAGGLIGGIVVGAAAGAAAVAIIGTGGAAAPLVVAAAIGVARFGGGVAGGFAGEWIADKLVPETVTVTGMVSTASFDVFINSKARGGRARKPRCTNRHGVVLKALAPHLSCRRRGNGFREYLGDVSQG